MATCQLPCNASRLNRDDNFALSDLPVSALTFPVSQRKKKILCRNFSFPPSIFLSPLLLRSAPLRVAGTFPSCLGVRGGVTTGTSHQLSSSQGHVGRPSHTLTIVTLRRLHAQVLGTVGGSLGSLARTHTDTGRQKGSGTGNRTLDRRC